MQQHSTNHVTRKCEFCGTEFQFYACPFFVSRNMGRFCSPSCRNRSRAVPLSVRFQRNVGPTNDRGCILWIGTTNKAGYGVIYTGRERTPMVGAHRIAYGLAYGPIPAGMDVLHRCDNPPCVNPEHLFLGTHADNMADKVAKGRGAMGERQGAAKVTDDIVREIRERHSAGGISRKQLAREYGLSRNATRSIILRLTWRHV
jgi:hypothetical protein